MTISPEHFLRGSIDKESSFKTGSGSPVQLRGLRRGSTFTAGRERIPVEASFNSKGDRYADNQGAQTYTAQLEINLHAAWFTDYADVFESAFGTKDTTASPTFTPNGDNFTFDVTGNSASAIVKLTGSDSKTYICPVDIDASGTLTLGIGLPTGITATAIVNPGSASGGCFECGGVGDSPFTFSIESDWAETPSSTTQRNILARGCAITSFMFNYARANPLTISVGFVGASYTDDGGAAANVSDPTAHTGEGPSWAGDFILSSSATAKWGDTQARVKTFSFEYAAPLVIERGAIGLDGGSDGSSLLSGSDITGYTRAAPAEGTLKIRVAWDSAYIAAFALRTAYRFFGVIYPGVPGSAPGSARTAVYFKRCVPVGVPVEVVEDGGRYMDLEFQVERDRTSNGIQERYALARFN